MSHPVWVRGLKLRQQQNKCLRKCVAPRVGAWIETNPNKGATYTKHVAPRVGAWIETYDDKFRWLDHLGRTPCGCVD